jgi:hypothetical protein
MVQRSTISAQDGMSRAHAGRPQRTSDLEAWSMADERSDQRDVEDLDEDQQEHERTSRDGGGDAEAAASIEEREAIATDTDDEMDADGDQ